MAKSVEPHPYALLTLDEYYDQVGQSQPDDQDVIQRHINTVTDIVERHCRRGFKARLYRNEIHEREREILLTNYPLKNLVSIHEGEPDTVIAEGTADSGSTTSLVDAARTEADDYWNGADLSVEVATGQWEQAEVNDFVAGTDTLSWLAAQTFETVVASGMAYKLIQKDKSALYELTQTDIRYTNFKDGQIVLNGRYSRLLVDYYAGFQTVPQDIMDVAVMMVRELQNPALYENLASMSRGGVSKSSAAAAEKLLKNPTIRAVLDLYKAARF